MADSFTPNLNLRKPEVGAAFDTWGGVTGLNSDLDLIDAIFLATGLGTSVGLHVGSGKVLNVDGTGTFKTTDFEFHDASDPTKVVNLSAAALTTATTRDIAFPNASGTLALTTDVAKRAPRGTILHGYYGATAPEGTLFLNGTTFGKGTSAATQRANDDTWLLFEHFWNTLGLTPQAGGRGPNALTDFNNNKVFVLPDHRGRTSFALDNNGGIASANVLQPGVAAGQATVRTAPVGQSTENASVSVTVAGNISGTASGTISAAGVTNGENQDSSGNVGGGNSFNFPSVGHTHNFSFATGVNLPVGGTFNGSGSGATAAQSNVPTGMMCDCVIVM